MDRRGIPAKRGGPSPLPRCRGGQHEPTSHHVRTGRRVTQRLTPRLPVTSASGLALLYSLFSSRSPLPVSLPPGARYTHQSHVIERPSLWLCPASDVTMLRDAEGARYRPAPAEIWRGGRQIAISRRPLGACGLAAACGTQPCHPFQRKTCRARCFGACVPCRLARPIIAEHLVADANVRALKF